MTQFSIAILEFLTMKRLFQVCGPVIYELHKLTWEVMCNDLLFSLTFLFAYFTIISF